MCPPRPPQIALAPRLASLRPFIIESSKGVKSRQELFKSVLPKSWTILSQGGYFAWVRHPYRGISSEVVCQSLARDFGIVTLPSSGFAPNDSDARGEGLSEDGKGCIRFAVANVTDEKIRMLGERLRRIGDDLAQRVR